MTLSIIIVNYNVYELLKNCIKSVNAIVTGIEYEIIVIDNNSSSDEIDNILIDFPNVTYIKSYENRGFAKANNHAFSSSKGKYLLFLNPDTILLENFVLEFIDFLEQNVNISACAPMLTYQDGAYQSSTGSDLGFFNDVMEAFYLMELRRKCWKRKYQRHYLCEFEVDWVSAACVLVRAEDFRKVNGFTNSYYLNYEDVDLCLKLRSLGKKIIYLPKFKCIHLDHKSFADRYDFLVYSRYKSKLEYFKLNKSKFEQLLSRIINISGLIVKYLFSYLLYSVNERVSRRLGYYKSLKLYLHFKKSQSCEN